jgi:hypothetical protein
LYLSAATSSTMIAMQVIAVMNSYMLPQGTRSSEIPRVAIPATCAISPMAVRASAERTQRPGPRSAAPDPAVAAGGPAAAASARRRTATAPPAGAPLLAAMAPSAGTPLPAVAVLPFAAALPAIAGSGATRTRPKAKSHA